ncbi:MAG: tetratricopeptide repeat protein [Bacteroidales bacterium]
MQPIRNSLFKLLTAISIVISGIYFPVSGQNDRSKNTNVIDAENIDRLIEKANYYLEGNLDSAIYFGEKAFQLTGSDYFSQNAYRSSKVLADAWFYKDSLAKAIDYYKVSADIILELEGEISEKYASRISDIGYCFSNLDIFEPAVSYFEQALNIFKKTNNEEEISNQLNNLGIVYFTWGKYSFALEYFSRTLGYDMERGDSNALTISYNNIGKVYEAWGYYELAIEHYLTALSYLGKNGSEATRAIRLSNIGTSHFKKKNYDVALEFLYQALKIDQQLNNQFKIAVRYNEIANVFAATGNYMKAIEYNSDALRILESLAKKESLAIVLQDLGANYFEIGNYPLAENYFKRSISISQEIGSIANEMAAYRVLSKVYEEKGDFRKAILYHHKYDDLKDTIFNSKVHKQLANYRIRYETEKKENENQLLKKNLLIKKRTQRTLIIIGALMLMSSVLLFFLLRLRSRTHKQDRKLFEKDKRLSSLELEKKELEKQHLQDNVFAEQQVNRLQREKYEAEIQLKNQELIGSTLQLVNKNEILTTLKSKINASLTPDSTKREILFINKSKYRFRPKLEAFQNRI